MFDRAAARAELARMKTEINLVDYAATKEGYERDRAKSSKSMVVMVKGGHRIVVMQAEAGRWYYYSPTHPEDKGTILDFVQRRRDVELAEAIKELRDLLPGGSSPLPTIGDASLRRLDRSTFNRTHVLAAFEWTRLADTCPYLRNSRSISQATLSSDRFRGTWRTDNYGNAVFPHHDEEGLCGFEKRGPRFKGFATSGRKALYASRSLPRDRELVFVETGIDAISHFELTGRREAMYVSTAGEPGREWQIGFMERFLARHPHLEVVAAFDANAAGERFTHLLSQIAGRPVRRERPESLARVCDGTNLDWNFLLQERVRASLERGGAAGRAR
jgi:hypothetical protein